MSNHIFKTTLIAAVLFVAGSLLTDSLSARGYSVQGGLSQPAIGGGNIAAAYYGDWIVLEYSHGAGLQFDKLDGAGLSPAEKQSNLKILAPYSTGFGVGLQLTKYLDLRLEFKENYYRVAFPDRLDRRFLYHNSGLRSSLPLERYSNGRDNARLLAFLGTDGKAPGESVGDDVFDPEKLDARFKTGLRVKGDLGDFVEETIRKDLMYRAIYGAPSTLFSRRAKYRTRSAGMAFYYRYFPLGGDSGLMIEPSLRFWPNVWTDLENNRIVFEDAFGLAHIHEAKEAGLFMNVSVGYHWEL